MAEVRGRPNDGDGRGRYAHYMRIGNRGIIVAWIAAGRLCPHECHLPVLRSGASPAGPWAE
eukprot:7293290-Prymnesium_polylepis.2